MNMGAVSKLQAAVVCALIVQTGVAFADPTSQVTNQDVKTALDSCPKGTVEGPDGVCVKPKSGRMGFDLAAPSDNDSAASTNSTGATRSIGNVSSAAEKPQKTVDLKMTFQPGSAELNDQDKANAKTLAAMLLLPKYAHAKVKINGSTDTTGSAADNLDLSKRRAESVKTFLVSSGVEATRLETMGYSHTKLAMSLVIAQRVE
jgi:outer membrane protein OmpA-like peptidoglycan-associated protein